MCRTKGETLDIGVQCGYLRGRLNISTLPEVECGLAMPIRACCFLAWSERFQIRRDADADLSEEKLNV